MMSLVIFLKSDVGAILSAIVGISLITYFIIGPFIKEDINKAFKKKQTQKREAKIKEDKLKLFDKNVERLEKLGKLYKDGIITKEEFEEKKKEFKI